jgi:hypothetical protein
MRRRTDDPTFEPGALPRPPNAQIRPLLEKLYRDVIS